MQLKLIRAEDLPASSVNGSCDSYAKVMYDGKELGCTSRIKRSQHPTYDLDLAFALSYAGPLYLEVDVYGDEISSTDLLGHFRVPFPEWRPHVEEYLKRKQNDRQRMLHQSSSSSSSNSSFGPISSTAPTAQGMMSIAERDAHRLSETPSLSRSKSTDGEAELIGRIQDKRRSSTNTTSLLTNLSVCTTPSSSSSSSATGWRNPRKHKLMDPIPPVLMWCTIIEPPNASVESSSATNKKENGRSSSSSPMSSGRVLVSIQLEERDLKFLVNVPYGTPVQDIFLPQNPRFQHCYHKLPPSWSTTSSFRPSGSSRQSRSWSIETNATAPVEGGGLFPWHEKLLHMVEEVNVTFHVNESNQGVLSTLLLTNYRIWIVPYRKVKGLMHEDVHTIAVARVQSANISQYKRSSSHAVHVLELENVDAGKYLVTLSPISRMRDSVRDSSREAEAKRLRVLHHLVHELTWLRLENNFCVATDLHHITITPEEQALSKEEMVTPHIVDRTKSSLPHDSRASEVDRMSIESHYNYRVDPKCFEPVRTLSGTRRRIKYSGRREFSRQGAIDHPCWRMCDLNARYDLCSTYPNFLLVPTSLDDETVTEASRFRSRSRFPVLTWLHPRTGAPLCRSSQPHTGVLRSTNEYDRALVWALRDAAVAPGRSEPKKSSMLQIIDARPEINAKGNALAGKGHESVKQYDRDGVPVAEITFMGIDNIHVVRNSFIMLTQALYEVEDANFFGAVHKSRWLEHVCLLLQGASEVCGHLERGNSVLVHCSDGWDRTAQLASLSQLMMDPYFRTLEGFAMLIEKDWCAFGHQFQRRCGYPTSDQTSPVFQLFLDAVYQLTVQFPTHFQFNELLLSTVAEAVYSSWYSTFQRNCERERLDFLSSVQSVSVWDVIRGNTDEYLNPLFDADGNKKDDVMLPVCRVRLMQLWSSQYQKAVSHMRLQQRELEMHQLVRQQEHQLSRLDAVLTHEQRLSLRLMQLHSETAELQRALNSSDRPSDSAATKESNGLSKKSSFTTRSRSNSAKLRSSFRNLVSHMTGHGEDGNVLSDSSSSNASIAILKATSSSESLTTEKHVDALKREVHSLESTLAELHHEIAVKENAAKTQLRKFRCYNYNVPENVMSGKTGEVFSPSYGYFPSRNNSRRIRQSSCKYANSGGEEDGGKESMSGIDRRRSSLQAFESMPELHNGNEGVSEAGRLTPGCTPLLTSSNVLATTANMHISQPVWERDGDAPCCKRCKKKFKSFYRPRHHCRCCGYVFCNPCTTYRMNLPEFGYYDVVRVCGRCYNSGEDS